MTCYILRVLLGSCVDRFLTNAVRISKQCFSSNLRGTGFQGCLKSHPTHNYVLFSIAFTLYYGQDSCDYTPAMVRHTIGPLYHSCCVAPTEMFPTWQLFAALNPNWVIAYCQWQADKTTQTCLVVKQQPISIVHAIPQLHLHPHMPCCAMTADEYAMTSSLCD